MPILLVDKKSGFKSDSPMVVIYHRGQAFYAKKNRGKGLRFNLPPGHYDVIAGRVYPGKVVDYPFIKNSQPNDITRFPNDLDISFIDNPKKCSVDLRRGKIYFDHSFRTMPRYVLMYVAGHELGHYYFKGRGQQSEKDCDTFSSNMMLAMGYNPSQINAAIKQALGGHYLSKCRKQYNLEKLKTADNI